MDTLIISIKNIIYLNEIKHFKSTFDSHNKVDWITHRLVTMMQTVSRSSNV